MRRLIWIACCAVFLLGLACAPVAAGIGSDSATATAATSPPEPTAEPGPLGLAPIDLLGKGYNPFAGEALPAGYTVYGAYFNTAGSSDAAGGHFVLCLTAEGNRDDVIRSCAGLLGISDRTTIDGAIESMTNEKVAEMTGVYAGNPVVATLKGTSADETFDECEEVDGCRMELSMDVDDEQASLYQKLILANENSAMLGQYAEQLNAKAIRPDMQFVFVNVQKPQNTVIGLVYATENPLELASKMAHSLDSTWYDERSGMFGLAYGPQYASLYPDYSQNVIEVALHPCDNSTPASDFRMSEISFVKLGFESFPNDGLCIYKGDQSVQEIAIAKPDWGNNEDWNFEFLGESNGCSIGMWYTEATGLFHISVNKGSEGATAEFNVAENAFQSDVYPDEETQTRLFREAAGISEGDHRTAVFALFEQTVQDRFGMTWQELYALPIW